MFFGGRSGDVPNLLKPPVEILFPDSARVSLPLGRLPVSSRFSLHEDKLHVVLDDGVWLIRFAQELRSVGDLVRGVGNFVPNDRVQVVKADTPADDANVSVKGKDKVASKVTPGDADIAHNAHETSSGNKESVNMTPDFLQLEQESFVVLDVAQLIRVFVIALEIPIRRRSDHEVH